MNNLIVKINNIDCNIYTNSNKSIIGLCSTEGFKTLTAYMWLFDINFEVYTPNLKIINDIDEIDEIKENLKNEIKNYKLNINECKNIIDESKIGIDEIKKYKVKKSNMTVKEFLIKEKRRTEEEILWPKLEDIEIINGLVQVPDRIEPFFYNTTEDLTKFNKGDKVEVEFGTGYRVNKKYKGKKLTFVVNNCKSYSYYGTPSNTIILTPMEDNWTKKDIVLLESYDRFETTMDGLFVENRIPFKGWKNKEVKIKKISKIKKLSVPRDEVNKMKNEDLEPSSKNEYCLVFNNDIRDYVELNVTEAVDIVRNKDYGINFSTFYTDVLKIFTTKDIEIGIKLFNSKISNSENKISTIEEKINRNEAIIERIEKLKEFI